MRAETVAWLLGAFVQMAPDVEWLPVVDRRPLEHARNLQVLRFLETRCTHLYLLDADCLPQDGTVQRLLAHGLPIVAAPHATRIGNETGLMVLDSANGQGYVQHRPTEGLQRVDAVGASGLLIRRDVFERLGPPWFACEYDERGLLSRSEDFGFCERAREAGYEIWCDCEMAQVHFVEDAI